jgi:hypothetical protein
VERVHHGLSSAHMVRREVGCRRELCQEQKPKNTLSRRCFCALHCCDHLVSDHNEHKWKGWEDEPILLVRLCAVQAHHNSREHEQSLTAAGRRSTQEINESCAERQQVAPQDERRGAG